MQSGFAHGDLGGRGKRQGLKGRTVHSLFSWEGGSRAISSVAGLQANEGDSQGKKPGRGKGENAHRGLKTMKWAFGREGSKIGNTRNHGAG